MGKPYGRAEDLTELQQPLCPPRLGVAGPGPATHVSHVLVSDSSNVRLGSILEDTFLLRVMETDLN